jgi:hypothetical protein
MTFSHAPVKFNEVGAKSLQGKVAQSPRPAELSAGPSPNRGAATVPLS